MREPLGLVEGGGGAGAGGERDHPRRSSLRASDRAPQQ